jgi:hypothetical protein
MRHCRRMLSRHADFQSAQRHVFAAVRSSTGGTVANARRYASGDVRQQQNPRAIGGALRGEGA